MRLKKLELYGFKSFAQRTEIVFTDGITGIVGPNGSGKSNIGDAVRWVLGEQSAKTLRGASMSDIIFNGTQKRKPLSFCEVSLVFDNEDRALPVDFAEVMVTRRVYRSGDSEYYLNRSACRLKDIIDLFRDTGIGKEGYSLIGQGRIDEILSRRSEDRRQIFEEAAGIVKFKTRKEEADKKLARTLENADRIDDILEELSRRLKPLEEQSRDARIYLELSAELKTLDLNLFLRKSDRMQTRLTELDQELNGLRDAAALTEQTLLEKAEDRDRAQTETDGLDEKLSGARSGLSGMVEQTHAAENRLSALNSRREARSESRENLMAEQAEAELRLNSIASEQQTGCRAEREQEAAVAAGEASLEQAREEAARAEREREAAEQSLESHKERILDAMNRRSAVQNDQTRLKTMRGQMAERLTELEAARDSLVETERRLQAEADRSAEAVEAEAEKQKECEAALSRARRTVDEEDQRVTGLRAKTDQLNAAIQSASARHRVLTEMTKEMEGYSQAVRRAIQFAADRRISGVRGVLAQLIQVPREYETAIDMALGAAQQNIITDTQETARDLIDYLRQNRLGRATFLPMDAIRPKTLSDRERSVLRMNGCIGVASELISCAPEYRDIIENLLGRTVIAEDLNAGIPIMRAGNHAFRLVTLAGDVMHSGGSMTGGSTQSRGAGLLSRERELKELEVNLKNGRDRLELLQKQLTEARSSREALRGKSDEALEALHQQEIAVAREQEHRENAGAELEAHRNRMKETDAACVQLRESIQEIDVRLEEASQLTGSAETNQSDLEEKTEQLQRRVSEMRAAEARAADRVMAQSLLLSDLRHALEDIRRESSRREEEQERISREQKRREEQLQEMIGQDLADAAETEQAEKEAETLRKEQEAQEGVIASLEQRRRAVQDRLRAVLHEMEDLHASASRDGERIHKAELARARTDADLRALQDRIWNTYELTYAGAEEFRVTEGFSVQTAERRAGELSSQIRALGTVNVHAVEEYADTKARYDDLTAQQEDLRRAEQDLRELIERLLQQMQSTFTENFTKLQGYFSETFVRLFGGGHAELTLLDPSDPLNCGIEVNAQPPGKKLQLLSLLSGGERALTAIAILFAMLKLKPTPFCILDEIEAALDDANIGYFADYLAEYSKDTQFVVVTHRKGTMERCDALYGVAMEEQGVSKMVSVSLKDYQE